MNYIFVEKVFKTNELEFSVKIFNVYLFFSIINIDFVINKGKIKNEIHAQYIYLRNY